MVPSALAAWAAGISPIREKLCPIRFDPERAVRIEQNVLGERVIEQPQDLFAKFPPKLHFEPLMLFVLDESESRHTKQM